MATTSPYTPPSPPAAPLRPPTPEEVSRLYRAVGVGLLTAFVNSAILLIRWFMEPDPFELVFGMVLVGLTVGLTWGLARWNRAAAVSLFLWVILNISLSLMAGGRGVGLLGLVALYYLWQGVDATMSWHSRKNRPYDPEEDHPALPREPEGPLSEEEEIRKVLGLRPPPPPA